MRRAAPIKMALWLVLGLNTLFWLGSKDIYARWSGVPPVPSKRGAVMMSLGDPEFSYRFFALGLQNLGDVGRDVTPLKSYDYARLGQWFSLLHALDPLSDHAPMIAAYYYGATRVPQDASVLVGYLQAAGEVPLPEKWRWLAHAAFLAQHRVHDLDLALKLAYRLTRLPGSDKMPQWARQMPVFILNAKGDRVASRQMMENMLMSEKNIHPEEINFMKAYLVEQLGADPAAVERLARMRHSE